MVNLLEAVEGVAPVWGRGLKSVRGTLLEAVEGVAPVWGRGLKWFQAPLPVVVRESPPYGGVD